MVRIFDPDSLERKVFVILAKMSVGQSVGHGVGIEYEGRHFFLTAYHVVKDSNEVSIKWIDAEGVARSSEANVISFDQTRDLAILNIKRRRKPTVNSLRPRIAPVYVGEDVHISVTTDHDLEPSIFAYQNGRVASIGTRQGWDLDVELNDPDDYFYEHDKLLIITHNLLGEVGGNAGSGLFDDQGEVVGILSDGRARLGFHVHLEEIYKFLDTL